MNIEQLSQELIRDEGKRSHPYADTVGKLTVGVGRNLDDRGLSDDEILYLLKNDIEMIQAQLDVACGWWRDMSEKRQRVICNMMFNLGINRLLGFEHTLQAMKEGRYGDAADGMLDSKWAAQVGQRAQRLATMMREG